MDKKRLEPTDVIITSSPRPTAEELLNGANDPLRESPYQELRNRGSREWHQVNGPECPRVKQSNG